MEKVAIGLAAAVFSFWGIGAANAQSMTLSSDEIKEGGTIANEQVFKGFGCTGNNISPSLSWSGAPGGTKSFALTIYDPDAPTGSGFWHWVVVNIPPDATELAVGAGSRDGAKLPKGALQTRTDFGAPGYGGPCPPEGDHPHRYLFTVFAVGSEGLSASADTSAAVVGFQLNFNTLAKAAIMGLYKR